MPSFTKNYNFGYFDYGDNLSSDYSSQVEIDRWSLLDKLVKGLISVFGSGVISGWELQVSDTDKLTLEITTGNGFINYVSAETLYPSSIALTTNTNYYIYAIKDDVTTLEESAKMMAFTSAVDDPNYLLLGYVTVGATTIETIDMSNRQELDLIDQIKDEIRDHHHRGGTLHPSKIDLQTEVKGQLPAFRIADIDAEKITTGVVDLIRLPSISHNLLANIGQLTHPQIESFIKTLEVSNKELFGEVATSNMLQQHILMKYLYDDPQSPSYISDGPSDKYYNNELIFIPGISPSEYVDTENTTAIVDTELHQIRGVPPTQGTTFYVTYDTDAAWNSAYLLEKVAVLEDKITLSKETGDTEQLTIENFNTATGNNEVLSDGTMFTKEIVNLDPDGAQIVSESNELNVAEGAFSAAVTNKQSFRLQYVKTYDTAQDWSLYDSFLIDVKTSASTHGAVKMYFVNSTNDESPHYVLLDTNELTENTDNKGFETRIISLITLSMANDIKKIVIYVDDLINDFTFYIDNIVLQRAILLPEEGKMIMRYSSSAPVVFNNIDWTTIEPTGTEIKVRARAANGTVLLTRSDYTSWLTSSEPIALNGTDLEIEITFLSDTTKTLAPSLTKLRLTILSDATLDGFSVDSDSTINRGSFSNTKINSSTIVLDTPIYVDSHYFVNGKSVQQIYYDGNSNIPELAVFGNNTPISPNNILDRVQTYGAGITVRSSSLFDPKSVVRLQNRNYLIADTFNDRILEMNEDSELVNGFGSINYTFAKLFPIAACVDKRSGILYLVWSRSVPFKSIRINRLSFKASNTSIPLRDNYDKPMNYTTAELNELNIEGQVMPIYLMDQNFAQVQNLTDVYLSVENDVIEGGIDSSSEYYKAIKTVGIPCFIGNFAYKQGIFAPTYANVTTTDGYIIANARLGVKQFVVPTGIEETLTRNTSFADIVQIDSNGDMVWGSPNNWVNFSPFFPGRAQQIDANTVLFGGVKPTDGLVTSTEALTFTALSGDPTVKATQITTLKTIFSGRYGVAGEIYSYNTTEWTYIAGPYYSAENIMIGDVDLNSNGYMVVAESSLDKSGRLTTIENGNVTYSYGEGLFGLINDVTTKTDGTMVLTT